MFEIPLMKNKQWKIYTAPHALVTGITNSGKSMFLTYLLYEFAKMRANIYIIDPKISDLYQIGQYLPDKHLAFEIEDTISMLEHLVSIMNERQKIVTAANRFGATAYDLNIRPTVLFYDELGALASQITKREQKQQYDSLLKNLVLKGRSAGIQVIFSLQQPNSNNLPTEIREQAGLKVCLGATTPISTREMLFGKQDKWAVLPDDFGVGWYQLQQPTVKIFESPDMSNFDVQKRLLPLLKSDLELNENETL